MSEDFNYKDFANQLRFQVRGVIPEKYREHGVYIRDMTYKMSMTAGERLAKENSIDSQNCAYITQIIAEWTVHKTIDMLVSEIPKNFHEEILNTINNCIYEYLTNCALDPLDKKVLNKVEKLVNKTFKNVIKELSDKNIIDKKIRNTASKQSNIDEMALEYVYTVPISVLDVLKPHPFITLFYFSALFSGFIDVIFAFYRGKLIVGGCMLLIFLGILCSFLTRESYISVGLPEDDNHS